jgi:hypothetical protein
MWFFSDSGSVRTERSRKSKSHHRSECLSRRRRFLTVEQLESRRVLAAAPVPTSLAIYSAPQSFVAGSVSGTIKVEILDQFGHAYITPTAKVIDIATTSLGGEFFNIAGTAQLPSLKLTINAGTAGTAFRYFDTVAGSPVIAVKADAANPFPNPATPAATAQKETVAAAPASQVIFVDPTTLLPVPSQIVTTGAATAVKLELMDRFNNVALAAASSTAIVVQRIPGGGSRTVVVGSVSGQEFAVSSAPSGGFFSDSSLATQANSIVVPKGTSTSPTFYFSDSSLNPFDVAFVTAAKFITGTQIEFLNPNAASQVAFLPAGSAGSPGVTFTAGVAATVNGQLENFLGAGTAETTAGTVTLTGGSATGVFSNFNFGAAVGVTVNGSSSLAGPFTGPITIGVPSGTSFQTFSFSYTDTKAAAVSFTGVGTFGLTTLISGTQSDVVVANPDLTQAHFTFSPISGMAIVNTPSNSFTIQLQDKFNNPLAAPAGGVTATLTSSSAGTYSFQAAGGANLPGNKITIPQNSTTSAAFTYTDDTSSGNSVYTITAADLTDPIKVGNNGTATVKVQNLPTQIVLSTNTLAPFTAGQKSGTVTVTLEDSLGNVVTAVHTTTITLSSTSAAGTFQTSGTVGNVTKLTIAAGSSSASFTYSDTRAGTPTLTVTDTTDAFTSQTVAATVNAGTAAKLGFATLFGGTIDTNTITTVQFVYLDAFGNFTTPPAGIIVTATPSGGTVTNMNAQAGTFDFQSATTGTFTIKLSSANPVLVGTTNAFTINVILPNGVNPPAFLNSEFELQSNFQVLTQPNQVVDWIWNAVGQAAVTDAPFTNPSPNFPTSWWVSLTGGAALSQTLNFTSIGSYTLTFFAEVLSPAADVTVLLDGSTANVSPPTIAAANISANAPTTITMTVNVLTTGSHTITVLSGQPNQNTTGFVLVSGFAFF